MTTLLDVLLVRTPPTVTSLFVAAAFWGFVIVTAAMYIPKLAAWLTDADLDDDPDVDDDFPHLTVVKGEIR